MGLKLNNVSKRGPGCEQISYSEIIIIPHKDAYTYNDIQ